MISIIVSSYNEQHFLGFEKSVGATIGVPFEIIKIYNPGKYGICEAYNIGAEQAKYPLLCFSHEDILFHTEDWGKKVTDIFSQNANLGLLGIAGSAYKSVTPSGWLTPGTTLGVSMNVIHRDNDAKPIPIIQNYGKSNLNKVTTIDGCWFVTRKDLAQQIKFDQSTFNNFHCYDIDYSMSVRERQLDVMVTFDVNVEHLSGGKYNMDWFKETLLFHKKWNHKLPTQSHNFTKFEVSKLEYLNFKFLIRNRKAYNITPDMLSSWFNNPHFVKTINWYHKIKLKIMLRVEI